MTEQDPAMFNVGISLESGYNPDTILPEVERAGIHNPYVLAETVIIGETADEDALDKASEVEGVKSVEDLRDLKRKLA